MTNAALRGKPVAGNPRVRFDYGGVALAATPRHGSLPCTTETVPAGIGCIKGRSMLFCLAAFMFAVSTMAATSSPAAKTSDLPEILLIGDSIRIGYCGAVSNALTGKATAKRLGNLVAERLASEAGL